MNKAPPTPGFFRQRLRDWMTLRKPVPRWEAALLGLSCVSLCFVIWWFVTRGSYEERIVRVTSLPSPSETFAQLKDLFSDELNIVANTLVTLRRVTLGFLAAVVVGVPLGVLAGCYPRLQSFLAPIVLFGRNIPLAALLPLLLIVAPSGEMRKVVFIFVACVAFVVSDTARAITDVAERYVDTAYTLGADRWQTMIKVLVPLAMPTIFGSFRVMYGLAFGYIMFAESMKNPDDVGGLGFMFIVFQRRNLLEHIYLVVLIIPIVALCVDQFLYWVQRQLFPHVYGGAGWLQQGLRWLMLAWDDLKHVFFQYELPEQFAPASSGPAATSTAEPPETPS